MQTASFSDIFDGVDVVDMGNTLNLSATFMSLYPEDLVNFVLIVCNMSYLLADNIVEIKAIIETS